MLCFQIQVEEPKNGQQILVTFPTDISVGYFEKLMVTMKKEKKVEFAQIFYEKIGKHNDNFYQQFDIKFF